MKRIYQPISHLLFILLLLALLISVGRTLLNFSKVYRELDMLKYTDNQKREIFFGDYYPFLKFIEKNTDSKSRIFLLTSYPDLHYLSKYFLYPRMVINKPISESIKCEDYKNDYDFLAIYTNIEVDVKFDCSILAKYVGGAGRIGYLLKL